MDVWLLVEAKTHGLLPNGKGEAFENVMNEIHRWGDTWITNEECS